MHIRDGRPANARDLAVDAANQSVDVVPELPVKLHPLARGYSQLEQHRLVRIDPSLCDQFAEGLDTLHDPLRIVQAVDAEEHYARVAKIVTDLDGTLGGCLTGRQLMETLGIDRDGIRPGRHVATVRHPDP